MSLSLLNPQKRAPGGPRKETNRLRVLWSAWSNDPFTETIEQHLAAAVTEAGGTLLRVVEGRRPSDDSIPTIDLQEATLADQRRTPPPPSLPEDFDRLVADTCAFERTAGLDATPAAVADRLRRCAAHTAFILRQFTPDVVLVWNGLLSQRAVTAALARRAGIPVRYCERGIFPGSWSADPLGVNAISSLVREPMAPGLRENLDTSLPDERRRQILDRLAATAQAGASAWGQPPRRTPDAWRQELGIPSDARVLFFPLQVTADTNMQFFSPSFSSSVPALAAVADALAGADDWFLLVKPHPKGNYGPGQIEQITARARRGRAIADINLHDALALSALVVTINSSVAAEAAWAGKPVLQLGQGVLSGKNIVCEYTPDQPMLAQILAAADAWSRQPIRFERALRLYDYLERYYLLDAQNPDHARRLVQQLQAAGVGKTPSATVDTDIMSLVRRFTWQPAVDLFEYLAHRLVVRRAVLLGFGQNARRLIRAAPLHPTARHLHWTAWDDHQPARQDAARCGLDLIDPWTQHLPTDHTLLVVTPRDAAPLGRRLQHHHYQPEKDWLYLIPPA